MGPALGAAWGGGWVGLGGEAVPGPGQPTPRLVFGHQLQVSGDNPVVSKNFIILESMSGWGPLAPHNPSSLSQPSSLPSGSLTLIDNPLFDNRLF